LTPQHRFGRNTALPATPLCPQGRFISQRSPYPPEPNSFALFFGGMVFAAACPGFGVRIAAAMILARRAATACAAFHFTLAKSFVHPAFHNGS
jgi:hypothetical protein